MLSGAGKYTRKVLTYLVNEWNSNHYHHHLPPTGSRGFERTCACCDPDLSFSGTLPWATHKSQWPDRREEEEKWERWRSAVRGRAPLRSTLLPTSVFSTLKWDGEHSHGARTQVLQAVHWIVFFCFFFSHFIFKLLRLPVCLQHSCLVCGWSSPTGQNPPSTHRYPSRSHQENLRRMHEDTALKEMRGLEGDGVREMDASLEFHHVWKGAETIQGKERVSKQTIR